jgi:hypothetical protein
MSIVHSAATLIADKGGVMKALVVYESMYGNTAAVGEAIASSLRARGLDADASPVTQIDPDDTTEVDLSRASTRKTAATDEKNSYAEPTIEPGLREWIEQLPSGAGRLAAAFDTRIDKPRIVTGSAAKGIGRRLVGQSFRLVVEPECFLVSTQNRLIEGELEHAARWGRELTEHAKTVAV